MTVGSATVRSSGAKRPVRQIAFYGFLGSGNLGNDASLETVLVWMRREYPDVRLQCITLAPEEIRSRHGIDARALSWRPARPARSGSTGIVAVAARVLGRLVDVPRSFALAGSADAVVVPGMGVLEESLGVKPWGLPFWLFLVALACKLRRRRFLLLDVGAEPITNRVTRALFVATVSLAAHVSYRDEWSAAAMRRAGAREPDALAPDLAFAHPDPTRPAPVPGLIVVGVMAYHDDNDAIAGEQAQQRYVNGLGDTLTRLTDAGDRIVLLGGDRDDTEVAERVAAQVRAVRPELPADALVVRDPTTFADLCHEMAQAEAVIATRFHNLICALRLARPTVCVGYAEKSGRLMGELKLEEYHQRLVDLDRDRLLAQLADVRSGGPGISADLARVTGDYAERVTGLLEQVAVRTLGLPDRKWMETS